LTIKVIYRTPRVFFNSISLEKRQFIINVFSLFKCHQIWFLNLFYFISFSLSKIHYCLYLMQLKVSLITQIRFFKQIKHVTIILYWAAQYFCILTHKESYCVTKKDWKCCCLISLTLEQGSNVHSNYTITVFWYCLWRIYHMQHFN